jgi:FKBP-type peptidyl-prolyl cis-trans isomerase FkpA
LPNHNRTGVNALSNMQTTGLLAQRAGFRRPIRHAWLAACLAGAALGASAQSAPSTPPAPAVGASVTLPSGLVMKTLKAGTGASPAATDVVKVHYRGTFPDGREFDSSLKRGQPAEFPLNRVIRCWTEGVQLMQVGGKAQLICPASIAYGERGTPGGPIPPNATLHFEVELLGISK